MSGPEPVDVAEDFDQVAEREAWTPEIVIAVLRSFVSTEGLQDGLNKFARDWADEGWAP